MGTLGILPVWSVWCESGPWWKGRKEGGLFCHKILICSKLPQMDRSGVKKFSLIGGLFCHKIQSCSKLPEMDRSLVSKNFPSWRGGGAFLPQNPSCSKLSEMEKSGFKNFPHWGRGFSATKTKVAQNCLKWIDLKSKKFPSLGGGLLPQKPKLLKIAWNG